MKTSNAIHTLSDRMFITLSLDGSCAAKAVSYSSSVACLVNDLNVSRYLFASQIFTSFLSTSFQFLSYHLPSFALYAFHMKKSEIMFDSA